MLQLVDDVDPMLVHFRQQALGRRDIVDAMLRCEVIVDVVVEVKRASSLRVFAIIGS